MVTPDIETSTREERLEFIREEFKCLGNCPICGKCSFLRGREARVIVVNAGESEWCATEQRKSAVVIGDVENHAKRLREIAHRGRLSRVSLVDEVGAISASAFVP